MRRASGRVLYLLALIVLLTRASALPAQDNAGSPPSAPPAEMSSVPPTATTTPAPAADTTKENPPPSELAMPALFGSSAFVNPHVGHAPVLADYRGEWFADEPVAGQPTNLGYFEQEFSLVAPVWQETPDEWTASLHARAELFDTRATLPDTGRSFPDGLYDVRLGSNYRHLFDNGWIAGGGLSIGSASDKPFHSVDELTAGVNAFLLIPHNEHDAWLFTLAYSPTAELPFPIPGVAYRWQPNEYFRVNLGLPFQLQYRPMPDLSFDLSYMLVRTVHARATYRLARRLLVYTAFDWCNEAYFLADRPDVNDRLFYYDMRLQGGVDVPLSEHCAVGVAGGYVFDRFYFEGQNYNDRVGNEVNVGNGPFLMVHGLARW